MMTFRVRSCAVAMSVTGALASAQYVEPDVEVLVQRSIGPAGDRFGRQVVALGDVNGDGVIDVGASAFGVVFALSGVDGSTLWFHTEGQFDPDLGASLASMDWNADGVLDLVAGAPGDFPTASTWIFSGVDGAVLATLSPPVFEFGRRVASGGDFDGDGNEDLLVGSPLEGTDVEEGRVDVYARGGTVPFSVLLGQMKFDQVGSAVAFLGEASVPSDGRDEIVVGVGVINYPGSARVYGWNGAVPVERFTLDLAFTAADIDGGKDVDGDGRPDFAVAANDGVRVFSGADGAPIHVLGQADFFASVALLGDVDGDSRPDIAAGAPFHASGASGGGRIFLWSGASGALLKTITSTTVDRRLGTDVREIGDLDHDGRRDLLVGARSEFGVIGSMLVFSLVDEVCFTLDFETEDDLVTPLANGQHIDSEFGSLATLSSSGANAGLAIFDSTPGGPNDPSQDRDLLVGSGNILILQTENFPPDANDVFPRPNDDEDGGTLAFAFTTPVEPVSVKLIDSDAGDAPLFVVLTDGAARQRVYTVPSNWTGDVLLGQPGQGTLDLATLAPQAGFGSIATASEDPQFDPQGVSTIAFLLDGSGGIDELAVCTASLPRASVRVRNGSGTNPMNLAAISRPVLGGTWTAALDCTGLGAGLATLAVRRWAASGTWSGMGEVLIGGSLLYRTFAAHPGTVRQLGWPIPFDLSLCGLEVHAQGLCKNTASGAGPRPLARATLSNALDLTLGF